MSSRAERLAAIQAEIDWLRRQPADSDSFVILTDATDQARDGLDRFVQFIGGGGPGLYCEASIRRGEGPVETNPGAVAALERLGFSAPDGDRVNYWIEEVSAPSPEAAALVEATFLDGLGSAPDFQLDIERS